jgi:hypothetical protein
MSVVGRVKVLAVVGKVERPVMVPEKHLVRVRWQRLTIRERAQSMGRWFGEGRVAGRVCEYVSFHTGANSHPFAVSVDTFSQPAFIPDLCPFSKSWLLSRCIQVINQPALPYLPTTSRL